MIKVNGSGDHMRVLVTGGAGFIGSILVRMLLEDGHQVRVMDTFNYGFDPLRDIMPRKELEIYPGDIRNPADVLKGLNEIDAIVHLAAIVGDPACAVQADKAVETNYLSSLRIAMSARDKGINTFIFASTCSVYGAKDGILDEGSELRPQSLYAETKLLAEKGIMDLTTPKFEPIILRLGTLYGLSPRPRFDLVINYLTGKIMMENKALIFGGDQWRPFLHVHDAARCFLFALTNHQSFKGGTYNVGSTSENYQMKEVGKIFERVFPEADIQYVSQVKDPRSYRVSFNSIERKGFGLTIGIEPTIREISAWIREMNINPRSPKYYNYQP
ncbi:MAG: NAD(P)-dependent oxidoreductase [Candidatus Thermoplasmatota archaeon]|jgi:nucleoside-diphosphate-sugar epimerase|nr:NAD(P)-dependent oxidoreductase [Candidatus Thermoplasmatota archaeon]